jgi:hypothetical protein
MVRFEAWALGKPVLANGKCEVLRGQCIRSKAGLYYETQAEFVETLRAIADGRSLNAALGHERPAVLSTALRVAGDRTEISRYVVSPPRRRSANTIDRGWSHCLGSLAPAKHLAPGDGSARGNAIRAGTQLMKTEGPSGARNARLRRCHRQ